MNTVYKTIYNPEGKLSVTDLGKKLKKAYSCHAAVEFGANQNRAHEPATLPHLQQPAPNRLLSNFNQEKSHDANLTISTSEQILLKSIQVHSGSSWGSGVYS